MAKGKRTNIHKNTKDGVKRTPPKKTGVNSGAPEVYTVL
jgi:hypothetical protein